MSYYTYESRPGYGRDDHMADEIIARAARRLGLAGAERFILQAAGFVSHAVGESAEVRIEGTPGTRRRMERALSAARREVMRPDCRIVICCYRTRWERDEDGALVRVTERRRGNAWVRTGGDA